MRSNIIFNILLLYTKRIKTEGKLNYLLPTRALSENEGSFLSLIVDGNCLSKKYFSRFLQL